MTDLQGPALTLDALRRFLPMHLRIRDDGTVLSVGPTLAKLMPNLEEGIAERLVNARPGHGICPLAAIREAVDGQGRLMLRIVNSRDIFLRGHGVRDCEGAMLLNLGFGISLHRAIRAAELTDDDFAPSDLAMELMFLREANRGVLHVLSRFNDQLAEARQEAVLQAQTDALTGLRNRRGLDIELAQALRLNGHRHEDVATPLALIHLDLDHFKQVNDLLGHLAGDELLFRVAAVLKQQVRKADTAARVGGDEFVLLMRGMTSRSALRDLSKRIIRAIRLLTPPELVGYTVSASMGIVIWLPGQADCPEDLLARADKALYQAKASGRSQAVIL
ncbi:GGDEF domain-containing protein [Paracoccus liaowanqingii]|uniref:diguanylate cyclase n=1 Tax=Paracoccus liaowanqingii TaxID=2560053 RepID=A0A4Z1C6R8_9RHOB|nr:GGDEF domain-containing protein [Paracoccus liaowanqingii]TGN52945.1 GGDEF domain-containing protein [Paracoccus liaowanqingii]